MTGISAASPRPAPPLPQRPGAEDQRDPRRFEAVLLDAIEAALPDAERPLDNGSMRASATAFCAGGLLDGDATPGRDPAAMKARCRPLFSDPPDENQATAQQSGPPAADLDPTTLPRPSGNWLERPIGRAWVGPFPIVDRSGDCLASTAAAPPAGRPRINQVSPALRYGTSRVAAPSPVNVAQTESPAFQGSVSGPLRPARQETPVLGGAAATLKVAVGAGATGIDVSVTGEAIADDERDGLQRAVARLLSRHGLVLGELRIDGHAWFGGRQAEER